MSGQNLRFNTPPGWPPPPEGWVPEEGWRPDPSWPPAPPGWNFWVPAEPTPDITPAPSPDATATLAPDTTATLAPDTTATLAPDTTATLAPDTTATPAPDTTATPAPDTTATPAPDTTATPAPDTTATPAPDTGSAPLTDAATRAGEQPLEQASPPSLEPATPESQRAVGRQPADGGLGPEPETAGDAISAEMARTQAELEQARADLDQARSELAQLRDSQAIVAPPMPDGAVEELNAEIEAARRELVELNDAVLLQQVGIYEYHHPLENAEAYKERLRELRDRVKETVRARDAILASDRFAYNNSLAQGRKMTADFSKLMLRAYNAEADNCVRSLRAGSIQAAIKRLDTAVETIVRLGAMMDMRVAPDYHALRIEELELTSDYLFKVQEEREAAREERERLREERRAEQELASERERLNKERAHYENALAAMQAKGTAEELAELQARLTQIESAIEQNDYRAANIRAGYVYVISNVGTFGPNVVKIGMTRRLDPLDRVRELGDASVPFPFDVHAIYFSDDAVALENELHSAFSDRRLNRVNLRREFFFATPAQVRDVLKTKVGNLLEFTEEPEATQYFQSHVEWPELEAYA